jgi:hypothetical protein
VFIHPPSFCHQQYTVWVEEKKRKKPKERKRKDDKINKIKNMPSVSFYLTMAT